MNSVLTLLGICLLLHSFVDSATLNKAKECYLAKTCIHSGNKGCGVDSEGTARWFLDSCDIHEYNCINEKDYKKASIDNCDNLAPEKHEEFTTDKNPPPKGEDYGPMPEYDEKDKTNNNLPQTGEEQYEEATLEHFDEQPKNENIPADNNKFFDKKFFGNNEEEDDKVVKNNYEQNDNAYQLSGERDSLYDDYDRVYTLSDYDAKANYDEYDRYDDYDPEYLLSDENYNTRAKGHSNKFFESKFFGNKYEADGNKPERLYDDPSYPLENDYEQNAGTDKLYDDQDYQLDQFKDDYKQNEGTDKLYDDQKYQNDQLEDDYEQNEGVDEPLNHKDKTGNSNKFFKNKFFDSENDADAKNSERLYNDPSYPLENDYEQNAGTDKLYDDQDFQPDQLKDDYKQNEGTDKLYDDQDYPNNPLEDDYEQNEGVDELVDYKDNADKSNKFFKSKFFENEDKYTNTDKEIANDYENADLLEDEDNASVVPYEKEEHPNNNYNEKLANNNDKKFFNNKFFD